MSHIQTTDGYVQFLCRYPQHFLQLEDFYKESYPVSQLSTHLCNVNNTLDLLCLSFHLGRIPTEKTAF